MKHGTQKYIAEKLGISRSFLNGIIKGRDKCPTRLAERLELLTGISRVVWVWGQPDEIRAALDERYEEAA